MSSRLFKLQSAKILFYSGALVSIVVAAIAAFKDREIIIDNYRHEVERLWLGEFEGQCQDLEIILVLLSEQMFEFAAIAFVLLVNLFYCSKLIEGVVFHLPYKILPWIFINAVNIVHLVIYFFSVDSSLGYLTLLTFCYIWLAVLLLFFEMRKSTNDESLEFSQQSSRPTEVFEVPYGNLNNDRPAV